MNAPALPAGGAYWRCTLICVLRPPRTVSKFTEPAVTTSEPGSDCQASSLFSTSLMISASQATDSPAGPAATQCDVPSGASVTRSRWVMNRGRFSRRRQNR